MINTRAPDGANKMKAQYLSGFAFAQLNRAAEVFDPRDLRCHVIIRP